MQCVHIRFLFVLCLLLTCVLIVALYWNVFVALRDTLTLPEEWRRHLPKSFHRSAEVVAPTGTAIGLLFIAHLVVILALGQLLCGEPRRAAKRKQQ